MPAARHAFAINSLLAPVSCSVRLMVLASVFMALVFSFFPSASFVLLALSVTLFHAQPPIPRTIPDSYYMWDVEPRGGYFTLENDLFPPSRFVRSKENILVGGA